MSPHYQPGPVVDDGGATLHVGDVVTFYTWQLAKRRRSEGVVLRIYTAAECDAPLPHDCTPIAYVRGGPDGASLRFTDELHFTGRTSRPPGGQIGYRDNPRR
jgi:hypothetical protein